MYPRVANLTLDIVKARLVAIGLENITEDSQGDIILHFKPPVFARQLAALTSISNLETKDCSILIPKKSSIDVIDKILAAQKEVLNKILEAQKTIPIEIIAELNDHELLNMIADQSNSQF